MKFRMKSCKLVNFVVLVTIYLSASSIKAENILLFFPGGTFSHALGVWPYATALAEKGHNVTFFTAHKAPTENPKIITVQPKILKQLMKVAYDVDRFEERRLGQEDELWESYHDVIVNTCTGLLDPKSRQDPDMDKLLNSAFDLVVVNSIYGDCGFIFAHHYKTKYIIWHSAIVCIWHPDAFGYPQEDSWIPDTSGKFSNYPLTLWDRSKNTLLPLWWLYTRYFKYYPKMEKIMQEFLKLDHQPSFGEMEGNAAIVLTNAHYSAEFARSFPPQIISVGGMTLWLPEKPIPNNFDKFLNSSGESGAVLISFGSSIDLSSKKVPKYYQHMFLNLIKKFSTINFILKWKGELPQEFQPPPKNLLHSEWLPQKEILRHEKMRAFITHGGLNSIHEATYYGIPLIVLPLFADQDFNAYRIYAQEVGIPIELREISPEILETALHKILSDPKYRTNMGKRSKLFRDRPQSPIDTAVYWTEFVFRHDDTSSLKPQSTTLTWYQKRLLDVYALLLLIAIAILIAVYFVLKTSLSILFTQKTNKVKQKKN